MPHKRNPIGSENICGLARMLRGYLLPILEDNALFHERDISHSSVERVALIDMIELFTYMLRRLTNIVKNLVVYEDKMEENINLTSKAIFTQRVLTALVEKGLSREESYDLVQPLGMKASLEHIDLEKQLRENERINSLLTQEEITSLFSYDYYLKNVDKIYKRVLEN